MNLAIIRISHGLCWTSISLFLLIAMQAFLPYSLPLDMITQAQIIFQVLPKVFILGFITLIVAEFIED